MSDSDSIRDYHLDIESIGRTFVYPLEDKGRNARSILFGAILPGIFILLGWTFLSFVWYQFIISITAVGTYQADPGVLLIAGGLFAYVTHFWIVLTSSIFHGISRTGTERVMKGSSQYQVAASQTIDEIAVEMRTPVSGRFDQPIGRWH